MKIGLSGILTVLDALFGITYNTTVSATQKSGTTYFAFYQKNNRDYNKDMLNYVLNEMKDSSYEDVLNKISEWCIEAYRKQDGVSSI